MCGISGYYAFSGQTSDPEVLWGMNRAIAHRGPDGEGAVFVNTRSAHLRSFAGDRTSVVPTELPSREESTGLPHDLAFGHRRFAIVERTPGGHQPFVTADGALALSFQGEIYNHVELREELAARGHVFRARGDAEVLAHAWMEWGEKCLSRLRGFWAMVLWDGKARALWLARDPIGKAPLYWARHGGRLWWSSEIKGLRAGAGWDAFPARAEAVAEFVGAGLRDFGGKTFYEGVETFPAGSVACVAADGTFAPRRFWEPPRTRLRAADIAPQEAVDGLATRLADAVRLRLRADAPVGVELSGGLDSSAIAGFAAPAASGPLEAFTATFSDPACDESVYARRVAEHWRGRLRLTGVPNDEAGIAEEMAAFHRDMDEPIHSPVLLLNRRIWGRMAEAGIRVSLNGAGGDEVFAGYGHEYLGPHARGLIARGDVAGALRELAAFSERDASALRAWMRAAWWMVPEAWRKALRPTGLPTGVDPLLASAPRSTASEGFGERLLDHLGDWKMNYWLRSGNTASMGVPVEVRLPLLDARVVEWACTLPSEYLIRDGWLKWALRKAADPRLPPEVTWRKVKMGFPFPLGSWLLESRLHFAFLECGEDPPGLSRARVFATYDMLAATRPAYLWRCLSVLLWWDVSMHDRHSSAASEPHRTGLVPTPAA